MNEEIKQETRGGKRDGAGRKFIDPTQKKTSVSMSISPTVKSAFEGTGKGWQTRMNLALEDWLKTNDPASLKSA